MRYWRFIFSLALVSSGPATAGTEKGLVWPQPPAPARIEYVGSIDCTGLSPQAGFFSKVKRFLGGSPAVSHLTLPFDVLVTGESIYLVCQNLPALAVIDRSSMRFRLIYDKRKTLLYPIALCDGGSGAVFLSDSEAGIVYRFHDNQLRPFITSGLKRPTGLAALPRQKRLYVVDTGEHQLKIYDYNGKLLQVVPQDGDSSHAMHFPTFACTSADDNVLVNDGLNYRIKEFDYTGNFLGGFGAEGNGPGRFARPKGIAVDRDNHIYVIDNLFDNLQVFDADGRILLVVGSAGQAAGQFWSPAGIDIANDTIYVADTFNNRIEMLKYLGEQE